MSKIIISTFIVLMFFSCQLKQKKHPLVSIDGETLYLEDISDLFEDNISYEDSIAFIENYKNKWIEDQLLYLEAKNNLENIDEIEKKVEEFRRSLYIHYLKEKILSKNSDSLINEAQLLNYYNQHKEDFLLPEPIIKGIFLKIPQNLDYSEIKEALMSSDFAKLQNFYKLIVENGGYFDDFSNTWKFLSNIQSKFPKEISLNSYTQLLEAYDGEYYYLLKIDDFVPKQDTMPFVMCKKNIEKILMTKKNASYIEDFKKQLFKKYTDQGLIKFY